MKKILIALTLVLLFVINGFAQMQYKPYELNINAPNNTDVYKRYTEGKTFLGVNTGLSLPFGDYGKNINLGMGFGIQAKYFITDNIVFGANFNYYKSSLKDDYLKEMDTLFMVTAMDDTTGQLRVLGTTGNSSLYPFTLSMEYYFSPKERFKPFLGLGLGFYVLNHNVEVNTNMEKPQFFREAESKFGSKIDSFFGLCPYAGFMLDFNELVSMDFDIRYNQMFSSPISSSMSINLGVIFNLAYKY